MRIITWNINGVRTLPQYHPWNTLKNFDDILNHLEADVICFQEMKSGRKLLTKPVAVPPSFDSFFSFPIKKTGYSGVAIYTRSSLVVPLKAEEGLSGIIQPKPPLSPTELVSREDVYPVDDGVDEDAATVDFKTLDSEGRGIVVDLGLFVLINVYCPNDGTGTEERDQFKMAYHRLLEARVKGLIEKEGREVMVVGDLNACAAVIDHCEGSLMVAKGQAEGLEGEEGFWGKGCRIWIRDWLQKEDGSGGPMVDIVRRLWPERKGMYTCWNTKISARESNYGTRIDFILITPGLLPWVKAADSQPHVKGSDHCPVYVDFHDEITDASGETLRLSDVLGLQTPMSDSPKEPPRIATKFWDEYSGKQTSLQQFFGGQPKSVNASATSASSQTTSKTSASPADTLTSSRDLSQETFSQESTFSSQFTIKASISPAFAQHDSESNLSPSSPSLTPSALSPPLTVTTTSSSQSHTTTSISTKRKLVADYGSQTNPKKAKKGKEKELPVQASIASFFAKPKDEKSATPSTGSGKGSQKQMQKEREVLMGQAEPPNEREEHNDDGDYGLPIWLSQDPCSSPPPPSSSQNMSDTSTSTSGMKSQNNNARSNSTQAWNSLLTPIQAPKCRVHGETTKEFTVNKPGPNKGKKFFICSRPVGPGYDKGRAERLREHVDPQYKCDYFKWSSEVRKEMMKNGNGGSANESGAVS